MNRKYAVISEQAETNWAAYIPDLAAAWPRERSGGNRAEYSGSYREPHPDPTRAWRTIPEATSVAREIEVVAAV